MGLVDLSLAQTTSVGKMPLGKSCNLTGIPGQQTGQLIHNERQVGDVRLHGEAARRHLGEEIPGLRLQPSTSNTHVST